MVRLKVAAPDPSIQYAQISIPLWCDWRSVARLALMDKYNISIPLWCDWRGVYYNGGGVLTSISIPLWCDWRVLKLLCMLWKLLFQFHYGAIEGLISCFFCQHQPHFNSIMVRLKATTPLQYDHKLSNFNSIMVRLKELPASLIIAPVFDFNSIMVRLKVINLQPVFKHQLNFNSIMVRLKEYNRQWNITLH